MTLVRVEVETDLERLSVVVELEAVSGAMDNAHLEGRRVTQLQAAAMAAVDEVRRQA